MEKTFLIFAIICLSPFIVLTQPRNNDCAKIRTGIFYYYTKKGLNPFAIIRENSIQKEINLKTGDTSFWKLNWQNNCLFDLKFIRKSAPISDDEKYFYNSHTIAIEVLKVKKDYYLFKGGLDSITSKTLLVDTMWFKSKSKR